MHPKLLGFPQKFMVSLVQERVGALEPCHSSVHQVFGSSGKICQRHVVSSTPCWFHGRSLLVLPCAVECALVEGLHCQVRQWRGAGHKEIPSPQYQHRYA